MALNTAAQNPNTYAVTAALQNGVSSDRGRCSWFERPLVGNNRGDRLQIVDINNQDFVWDGSAWMNPIYATDGSGNVIGLVKPDATTYGLILGPVLYSALPAAASYSGYMCKVSDVGGSTGSLWISDGVRWKPVNGALTLYSSDAASAAVSGVTETIQRQILLPAGLLRVGDRLVCKVSQSKSSTSETATTRIRLGTAGTTSDTQIAAIAAMTTTNVSVGWTFDMRVNSATTVQKMGGASTALPWGVSTGAFPAATTVSSVTANALYLSFSSFMSSTVETTLIEDLSIELRTTTT